LESRTILHNIRWLAVIALEKDDDIAKVFVAFIGLDNYRCSIASKIPLAAAVDFHFPTS
jgi:hypothetical protein